MADQTVRVQGFPDSGSPQRVAYDLTVRISNKDGISGRKELLDLYAECLRATQGQRG